MNLRVAFFKRLQKYTNIPNGHKKAALEVIIGKYANKLVDPEIVDEFLYDCVKLDCADMSFKDLAKVCEDLEQEYYDKYENFITTCRLTYGMAKALEGEDDRFNDVDNMTVAEFASLIDDEVYEDMPVKEASKKSGGSKSGYEPTDKKKWNAAKAKAKKKFDVYPSAYANLWASKEYKKMGGGWRKKKSKK